jgi:hypothetical protein
MASEDSKARTMLHWDKNGGIVAVFLNKNGLILHDMCLHTIFNLKSTCAFCDQMPQVPSTLCFRNADCVTKKLLKVLYSLGNVNTPKIWYFRLIFKHLRTTMLGFSILSSQNNTFFFLLGSSPVSNPHARKKTGNAIIWHPRIWTFPFWRYIDNFTKRVFHKAL